MNDFYKDILTGAVFLTGLIGFISGEFIISSTLFATAAIASNVNLNRKRDDTGHLSCDWCPYLNNLTKWLKDFQGLRALEVFLCLILLLTRLKSWHWINFAFSGKTQLRTWKIHNWFWVSLPL